MHGMTLETVAERRRLTQLARHELEEYQLRRLNQLIERAYPTNALLASKLKPIRWPLASLAQWSQVPYTYKEELHGQLGTWEGGSHLTFPLERYVRFHHTSGTRGRPLIVLDTAEDWQWWIDTWQYVLDAAEVTPSDRALMAFSFGPFIGFWSAHDAAVARGSLVIPGGGLNTLGRLELIRTSRANALFCTPSYALHLVEVAAQHQMDVGTLGITRLILAGEPGGSLPAVRQQIERAWRAKVLDHAGATEVGPWGVGRLDGPGLYVIESEFLAEFRSVAHGGSAEEGELAELVLTNLGRVGCPVLRYRTGDLVRPMWRREGECRFVWLEGGILGRADDMLVIRGVNIFPSAVEQILRSFPEVIEYRITVYKEGAMDQLRVDVEDRLQEPQRVTEELRLRLGLKVHVRSVPLGTLPRFEGKGQRFHDQR